MADTIIKAEGLSKSYWLSHQGGKRRAGDPRYERFSEVIMNALTAPFRRKSEPAPAANTREEFWALRDLSFEIKSGEVVGIIGRNGAGKSTLLKILSRITEPTTGRVEIDGRVASLLEVGTGFHPELTGRENVFLNGAVLGMNRVEIRRKFDEIVAFAEVEKFLDTPVKRYSSGMYVRLAFAVAAHLEPEILIVDEVLAVGDARFQKKCLGKLHDVASQDGRTVLFVSHNLGVVANLCSRVFLLRDGQLAAEGPAADVISNYIEDSKMRTGEVTWERGPRTASELAGIRAVRIISEGRVTSEVAIDQPLVLELEFEAYAAVDNLCSIIHLFDKQGVWVMCSRSRSETVRPGCYRHRFHFPGNFFNDGRYSFELLLARNAKQIEVFITDAISFFVHETGMGRDEYGGLISGCIRPLLEVETQRLA